MQRKGGVQGPGSRCWQACSDRAAVLPEAPQPTCWFGSVQAGHRMVADGLSTNTLLCKGGGRHRAGTAGIGRRVGRENTRPSKHFSLSSGRQCNRKASQGSARLSAISCPAEACPPQQARQERSRGLAAANWRLARPPAKKVPGSPLPSPCCAAQRAAARAAPRPPPPGRQTSPTAAGPRPRGRAPGTEPCGCRAAGTAAAAPRCSGRSRRTAGTGGTGMRRPLVGEGGRKAAWGESRSTLQQGQLGGPRPFTPCTPAPACPPAHLWKHESSARRRRQPQGNIRLLQLLL